MVKKNKTSKDGKIVQNVNIKIGDSSTKSKKTKRRRTTTKKQAKPPMSNFQYPQPILIQQQPQQLQREQIKKDENIAKQIQLKFDEEYAKRENEKATKKQTAVPGAFQSVDDGNGFSQEISRMNKTFVNNSASAQTARLEPENIYQRSNLLNEIKTPIKLNPVIAEPVNAKDNIIFIDGKKRYKCEICGNDYSSSSNLNKHINTKHATPLNDDNDNIPALIDENGVTVQDNEEKTAQKKEAYGTMLNAFVDRKILDNNIINQNNLNEATRDPSGDQARQLKNVAFRVLKTNNTRINDEIEENFQNALNWFQED